MGINYMSEVKKDKDKNSEVCHVGQKGEIDNQIYFISMCTYYTS